MLGRLKMSMDEAITAYLALVGHVFSDKKTLASREPGAAYKGTKLQESLRRMVRDATGNEYEQMLDEQAEAGRCKT